MKKLLTTMILAATAITTNAQWNNWHTTQAIIKSKHSDKLRLSSVENITVAPTITRIPWPYQKLRFALIFPALPAEDGEFDLIEPSSDWKFKELR